MSDESEMTNLTEELRVKLPGADHAFLNAVALGTCEDMQSIVRRLIHEFLEGKRHEYKVAARFYAAEGIARASRGSDA
jgi:hypothetical protein